MQKKSKRVDLIVGMLCFQFAFYLIVPSVTGRMSELIGMDGIVKTLSDMFFYVLRFAVPLCIFFVFRSLGGFEPITRVNTKLPRRYNIWMFFAAFMLIFMIGNVYFSIFDSTGVMSVFNEKDGVADNIVNFLCLVIVPVLVEEMMFRGVVLKELALFGTYPAVIFSSLLYALMFYEIESFPYAFIVGMIIGIVYIKNRSLIYVVLIRVASETFLFLLRAAQSIFSPQAYLWTVVCVFAAVIVTGFMSVLRLLGDKGLGLFAHDKDMPSSTVAEDFFTWPLTIYIVIAVTAAWIKAFT